MKVASVYLNPAAQTQLAQLKAANAIPLNRIDARTKEVNVQQSAVASLKDEAADLRTALGRLRASDEATREAAVQEFVKQYNELSQAIKNKTDKNGALARSSELRFARTDLRSPFQSIEVLNALKDVGIQTTREGLEVSGTAGESADMQALVQAFEQMLSLVDSRMQRSTSSLESTVSRLARERERYELQVARADRRTEASFMKMYQFMQAAQAAGAGNATGGISFFA